MVARPTIGTVSVRDFAALENASDAKHELVDGHVVAMGGGSPEHAALAAAVSFQLTNGLKGKPCRVYSSDLRVAIPETSLVTYPDVSVVCGHAEQHPDDRHAVTNPVVVVEILSDSSEAYDRGAKALHYRRLASLREYVLVSQRDPRIEVQRKNAEGRWELFDYGPGESAVVLGVVFDVDAVYANPLA
jgi:Uma2 family endonuclease